MTYIKGNKMRIDIYKDNISYVTNEMSSINPSEANLSEYTRVKFVTDLAAVSRGKDSAKNPEKRYKALLKEAAPQLSKETYQGMVDYVNDELSFKGSPSRPLEFLPIVFDVFLDMNEISLWEANYDNGKDPIHTFKSLSKFNNELGKFSYLVPSEEDNLSRCYTNMRACINAGIPYEAIPYNTVDELKDFRALKANIPMFVWGQVPNTHTALSKEAQSDRVTENVNYWLPSDFMHRVNNWLEANPKMSLTEAEWHNKTDIQFSVTADFLLHLEDREDIVNYLLTNGSQTYNQNFFKALGYPKEIYSRAMYYFKYKEVVFTGWYNDPKVFQHLFIERNNEPTIWKNWTQKETKQFVSAIKEVVQS